MRTKNRRELMCRRPILSERWANICSALVRRQPQSRQSDGRDERGREEKADDGKLTDGPSAPSQSQMARSRWTKRVMPALLPPRWSANIRVSLRLSLLPRDSEYKHGARASFFRKAAREFSSKAAMDQIKGRPKNNPPTFRMPTRPILIRPQGPPPLCSALSRSHSLEAMKDILNI